MIRLDHLYDFYITVSRNNNALVYDFSKLDKIVTEIRSLKATPFISLSYMPSVLNSDLTGAPSSYNEYQQVVRATIEHISGKNGLNIPHVYYEVWNEPDLFGQWKTYGDKNYLNLYQAASLGASSAVNTQSFKLGGPGTTKLYKNWILNLVDYIHQNNLRLDFISWHNYSLDPYSYKQDTDQLKSWLSSSAKINPDLEIILSEWGPNSANDPLYDNAGGAAHLVSSLSMMLPTIDRAFIFEIQDGQGPAQFWQRWGLFTHSSFGVAAKPRAEVIPLLNQLGPQQLAVDGQGSWVNAIATKTDTSLSLLVSNFDPENLHAETVPLTINSLPSGSYRLTQTYLGKQPTTNRVEVTPSPLNLSLPLPPNSVLLLTLTPTK